jgi:hypothetical protein
MAVSGNVSVALTATLAKAFDIQTGAIPLSKTPYSWTFASGTAANQADRIFSDTRTTSGTDSLDLAGVLLDAFGDAFTLARVKLIYVTAAAANAADIRVTRSAANGCAIFGAASDYVLVRPGGVFLWAAPDATAVAVAAGSSDILEVTSASGSVTYDIVIIGASA